MRRTIFLVIMVLVCCSLLVYVFLASTAHYPPNEKVVPGEIINSSATPFRFRLTESRIRELPLPLQSARTTSILASSSREFSDAVAHAELSMFVLDFGSAARASEVIERLRAFYGRPSGPAYGSLLVAEADGLSLHKVWVNGQCIQPALVSFFWRHDDLVLIIAGHNSERVDQTVLSVLGRLVTASPREIRTVSVESVASGHECGDWEQSGEITCRSTRNKCI